MSPQEKKDDSSSESADARHNHSIKNVIHQVVGIFSKEKNVLNEKKTPQPNKKGRANDPVDPDQWWNEYPIEGDPNRPAVIFANLLSKSPRLIGWNEEKWEQMAIETLEKNRARDRLRPPDEIPEGKPFSVNEKGQVEIDVSFGFIERVADAVAVNIERFVKASEMNVKEKDTVEDDQLVKDSELYQAALRSLRWQRDAYLVGPDHANKRQVQRDNPDSVAETMQPLNWNDFSSIMIQPTTKKTVSGLPYDASALGNVQLARLGEWFIPSRVVQKALLPMVLGLPRGPLYQPCYNVTTNLIPMSQPTLDRVMKNSIIWFLEDDQWKGVIKRSMNGYISTTYRDDSSDLRRHNTARP